MTCMTRFSGWWTSLIAEFAFCTHVIPRRRWARAESRRFPAHDNSLLWFIQVNYVPGLPLVAPFLSYILFSFTKDFQLTTSVSLWTWSNARRTWGSCCLFINDYCLPHRNCSACCAHCSVQQTRGLMLLGWAEGMTQSLKWLTATGEYLRIVLQYRAFNQETIIATDHVQSRKYWSLTYFHLW